MDAPVGREHDLGMAARAGYADMGEAALLFETGAAAFIKRTLAWKQALLPAGQEDHVEFEPLRGMQRHQADALGGVIRNRVHDQRDVFEKARKIGELVDGAHQFLEVFQTPGRVRRAVLLPHVGVAAFLQHHFGDFGGGGVFQFRGPAREGLDKLADRGAGLGLEFLGLHQRARRLQQRRAGGARVQVQLLQGGVAEAALGHVEDALEGEIVGL